MAEDKMENGYELWLKCCDNTKSGEVKRFLEVPYSLFSFEIVREGFDV